MKPGEKFETNCHEYLKTAYANKKSEFYHDGGTDSTKSDIAVKRNGKTEFYIEAKDTSAQSGQFVLLPNEAEEKFVFSPRNKSRPNEMTQVIIDYINGNFKEFNNAGTAGKKIDVDTAVFAEWIVGHYKEKASDT